MQRGLSTLGPEDVHSFEKLMKADPHLRSYTYSMWMRARYDMEMVSNLYQMHIAVLIVFLRLQTRSGSYYPSIRSLFFPMWCGMEGQSVVSIIHVDRSIMLSV